MPDRRPEPEALLAQVREEERRATRGRLKIFFGAAPGVGKTYAMLEAARARAREGVDVLVGVVETHGRPETAALLEGLPTLPRRAVEYRGIRLQEFDLDAALARRPGLLLVDELAHTNAPGSRHAKRWQDVEELLGAGISVYSTLNVQHLESLNDVVAQITGVTVRETLPDSVFDQADELELADLSADDLLARLREGKVYLPEQVAHAVERFFRKGNLIALRELTLRRAAERVDAQMRGYMREAGIHATWPAGERLLVSIGPNPEGARLVRAGKRMATGLKCEWRVVYVERPGQAISQADRDALAANLQLAESLGAETAVLSGHNTAEEILAYARDHNVTKIVVGKPTHPRWRDKIFGSVLDQLVRGSGDMDVYAIRGDVEAPGRRPSPAGRRSPLAEYGWATLITGACTVLAALVFRRLSTTDVAMVYLLGVVLVASRYGRGPSIAAALLSIALFDFFFVPPYYTFAVSDVRYLLTFAVMLVIAMVISALTLRLRAQAETARERERRTAALYAMSRDLAATRGRNEVAAVASRHLEGTFGARVQILLADEAGRVAIPVGAGPAFPIDEKERSVAQWVFDRGQAAGAGTDTLSAAQALYVPLTGAAGPVGVAGVRLSDPKRLQDPMLQRQLETFAAQAALALERVMLAEKAQSEQVEAEAERLRTALLSSLSHDMRTPLGAITGAASSLLEGGAALSEAQRHDLLKAILDESQRMNRLIGNLLDMIRVETGALEVQRDWQPLEEIVGVALIRVEERLRDHPVEVKLPADLPLLEVDGLLIEQVLVNLLENAAKYTSAGTPIEISAAVRDGVVQVDVADRGPGLPPGEEGKVFDKFYRIPPATGAASGGVGLGLTICRGIVMAHGGRIWAENRPGGGAVFRFTLPLPSHPPEGVPGEPAES
ncbi:MAG TPA: sensor histidine kinase KdpD [Gemmatimonadales bacterium]|nr:sensor histidine kinase KdpD [Gemmatimonadales bacterium]